MRNVADKNYRENQNSYILCSIIFFPLKSYRLCNNVENIVEAGGPQMTIWRTRIECWITRVYTRCGNKETGLLLLLISGHVDDEEEGRALTRGLPSTVTQRFIHAHRLVWP